MRWWNWITLCLLLAVTGCQSESGTIEGLEKAGAKISRGLDDRPRSVRFLTGAVTAESVQQLQQLESLQDIHGTATGLSDEQVAAVMKLPKLTAVSLLDSDAGTACIKAVAASLTLSDLDLSGGDKLTDEAVAGLKGQVHLRVLKLDRTPLTDASADVLASLKNLEELSLLDTRISVAGLKTIAAGLPQLRILRAQSDQINDDVVDVLLSLQQLEEAELSGSKITSARLSELVAHKTLGKLLLADCPEITNDAVLSLGAMEALRELDVSGSQFNGEGFNASGFRNLESIGANNCPLTNESVVHFTGVPKLYSVKAKGTKVNEQGVRAHFGPTSSTIWSWDQ